MKRQLQLAGGIVIPLFVIRPVKLAKTRAAVEATPVFVSVLLNVHLDGDVNVEAFIFQHLGDLFRQTISDLVRDFGLGLVRDGLGERANRGEEVSDSGEEVLHGGVLSSFTGHYRGCNLCERKTHTPCENRTKERALDMVV